MCCYKFSAESKFRARVHTQSIFLRFPLARTQTQGISLMSQGVLCPLLCELGESNEHRSGLTGLLVSERWACLLLTSAMSSV